MILQELPKHYQVRSIPVYAYVYDTRSHCPRDQFHVSRRMVLGNGAAACSESLEKILGPECAGLSWNASAQSAEFAGTHEAEIGQRRHRRQLESRRSLQVMRPTLSASTVYSPTLLTSFVTISP